MTSESGSQKDSGRARKDRSWVNALEADQRRRWEQGDQAPVEAYLGQRPELASDVDALLDLIVNEVVLRHERGEKADLGDYQTRFPHLAAELAIQFEVDDALRSLRATSLEGITPTGAVRDFPDVSGYEVLRLLGHGGGGVVYLARHRGLKRLVALKVLRDPIFTTPEEQTKLRGEAETLARLQHPNIVQIFDVGEYAGRPYLALEYAEGGSLDRYLDGTPQPAEDAAALLHTLARAIHAAHQAQVVHRDLKPGNILLQKVVDRGGQADTVVHPRSAETETGAPKVPDTLDPVPKAVPEDRPLVSQFIPKVTDFGLAKVLPGGGGAAGPSTSSKVVVGTMSYMAPEQARGEGKYAGPTADVYGLGAILYECLTGRPPFLAATLAATQFQVLHDDPIAPSRLLPRGIPRDLETICLKCLRKEPPQRYPSAEALADDLRHYLDGKPIIARPVGLLGRGAKWVRRRPLVAGLAAALFLALVGGLISTTLMWRQAVGERERVEMSYRLSFQAMNQIAEDVLDDPHARSGPLQDVRRKVLQAKAHFYEQFVALQGDKPAFQAERGRAYRYLGDVIRELYSVDQAIEPYEQALAIYRDLAARHPTISLYRVGLAHSLGSLALTYTAVGRERESEQAFQEALDVQKTLARHDDDPVLLGDLAGTYTNLGVTYAQIGRHKEAEQALRNALELLLDLSDRHADVPKFRADLAAVYVNLGKWYGDTGRKPDARQAYQAALPLLRDLVARHNIPKHAADLAKGLTNLGGVHRDAADYKQAEAAYQEALTILSQMVRRYPVVAQYRVALATLHNNWGMLHSTTKRPREAERAFDDARQLLQAVLDQHPDVAEYQYTLGLNNNYLGICLFQYALPARYDDAEKATKEAVQIFRSLATRYPLVPEYAVDLGGALCNLGRQAGVSKRLKDALESLDEAVATLQPVVERHPRAATARQFLCNSHVSRGAAYIQLGDRAKALTEWDHALVLDDGTQRVSLQLRRGLSLAKLGKHSEAAAAAGELAARGDLPDTTCFELARVFALSAIGDVTPQQMDSYSGRAVQLLRRAAAGRRGGSDALQKMDDFKILRDRPDFQKLLADLEAGTKQP